MRRLAVMFALLVPSAAFADCASDAAVADFIAAQRSRVPAKALVPQGDMNDALCTQSKLAAAYAPVMGEVVGYKAGLTSKAAQDRFGATEPVRGLLYAKMMLPDGASVREDFASIPMVEADLVLVVDDATINEATSPAEVMVYIASVHPFIELADIALAKGEPMTPVTLTAMGVGAKLGVLGDGIPVVDAVTMAKALETMTVTLTDGRGEIRVSAPGSAVLDHPANAVLWLMANGVTLKKGDLISVGSFGPLLPAGDMHGGVTVRYDGLPGTPTVSVTFTN